MPKITLPTDIQEPTAIEDFKQANNICSFDEFKALITPEKLEELQNTNYLNTYIEQIGTNAAVNLLGHAACDTNFKNLVEELLKEGVNPLGDFNEYDFDDDNPFLKGTPLHAACAARDNLEIVKTMLPYCKGPLDIRNHRDDTPIIDAAENGNLDVVIELLNNGADPNLANKYGYTLLHSIATLAINEEDALQAEKVIQIFGILQNKQVNFNPLTNDKSKTPLDIVNDKSNLIIALLENNGGFSNASRYFDEDISSDSDYSDESNNNATDYSAEYQQSELTIRYGFNSKKRSAPESDKQDEILSQQKKEFRPN